MALAERQDELVYDDRQPKELVGSRALQTAEVGTWAFVLQRFEMADATMAC